MIVTTRLQRTLVVLFALALTLPVFSAREKYSNQAGTRAGYINPLTSFVSLLVQDTKYQKYAALLATAPSTQWGGASSNPSSSGKFYDKDIKNRVILSIDHSDKTYTTASYSVTVYFNVIVTKYLSGGFVNQTITNKSLTVSNNQASFNKDKAVYEFAGGNSMVIQVTGISISNPAISLANSKIQLEGEIDIERYYYFNPNVAYPSAQLKHCSNDLVSKGELEIYWQTVEGAEEYELEWVHVSNYDGSNSTGYGVLGAASILLDEKTFEMNSTRITTTNSFFRIPYIYERGFILYRLRALGRNSLSNFNYNIPAKWSADIGASLSGGSPITNVSLFPNKFPLLITSTGCNTNENFIGLNEGLNWQSSISYAEEGKSKAIVNYSDGGLRGRQSITKLKSSGDIIIGETVYDFNGRPAINILPVPANTQKIEYTPNFNLKTTNTPYNALYFDLDANNCTSPTSQLVNSAGASKYYSTNNGTFNDENAYIPDANGFPMVQTEYTPDNTGRVRSQGGVGATHQLGTGRETKYYYGVPEQKDLNRLFGSEVGDALRYKKNMVIDPNGQSSITYLDPGGQTIATALAGSSPSNLTALTTQGAVSTVYDLLNKINSNDNTGSLNQLDLQKKSVTLNKSIIVPANSPYIFTYAVTPPLYNESCGNTWNIPPGTNVTTSGAKCYNCVLDLKVSLKNECGEELFSQVFPAGAPTTNTAAVGTKDSTNCTTAQTQYVANNFKPNDPTNSVSVNNLKSGSYSLEKILSINQAALDLYTRNYLDTNQNSCLLKLSDFKAAQNTIMNTFGCNMTCATCTTQLGSYSQYSGSSCNICLTQAQYDKLVEECNELCNQKSEKCEASKVMLEADMSPSGQYGKYSSGSTVTNNNIQPPTPSVVTPWLFPLSVYNEANKLPRKGAIHNDFTSQSEGFYPGGSSGNWSPDWRHPYNPSEPTTGKRFAYLDENGNIAKVKVTPVAGASPPNNFNPPVYPYYYTEVSQNSAGDYLVEPRFLLNVEDFINLFENSWATSLINYHPEYPFYERCLQDGNSNDFEAMYTEINTVTGIQSYIQSLSTSYPTDAFMYPVGKPSGTNPPVISSGATIIDPYFGSGGNGSADLSAFQTALINFRPDPASIYGYISIWETAYRIVNCPSGGTGPCPIVNMPTNYVFNDAEFNVFKGLYLSLKQSFMDKNNIEYAKTNFCYNVCIGNDDFSPYENQFYDPNAITVSYSPFSSLPWFSSFPTWGLTVTNISQYYNPMQPCNVLRYFYYKDKTPRFPTAKMLMPGALDGFASPCKDDIGNVIPCPVSDQELLLDLGNQADMTMAQNCGQCPTAVNFQSVLKGLVTYSSTTSQLDITNAGGVQLTCAPNGSQHTEFGLENAQDLFGLSAPGSNQVYWTYLPPSPSNALYLKGKFSLSGSSDRLVEIMMPSMIVPVSGTPGIVTSYLPFTNIYTYTDIIDVCCLKHNAAPYTFPSSGTPISGVGRFTATVTVKMKSGDPAYQSGVDNFRQFTVEGNVTGGIDFQNCTFNNVCKSSKEIQRLRNLVNALLYASSGTSNFLNTALTNVPLNTNPYVNILNPDLINDFDAAVAPSVNNTSDPWYWDVLSASGNAVSGKFIPTTVAGAGQCDLSITKVLTGGASPYSITDLKQIFKLKPSNAPSALAGDFTGYGLFRNSGVNGNKGVYEPITGNVSCFDAGDCGQNAGEDFNYTNMTPVSYEIPIGAECPRSDMGSAFANALVPVTNTSFGCGGCPDPTYTFASSLYLGVTFGSCNYTLNIPQGSGFSMYNVTALNNIYFTTINSISGATSFYVVATINSYFGASVTQTVVINGITSCNGLITCPAEQCTNGNLIVNGDFEQGTVGFGSNYIYTQGSSLARTSGNTISQLPYAASDAGKKYNVYPVKPAFTPNTSLLASDHTGYMSINPVPSSLPYGQTGNGQALAFRSENNNLNYPPNTPVALADDVWFEYVNLKANSTYTFNAYYRRLEGYPNSSLIQGSKFEVYFNGNLVATDFVNNTFLTQNGGWIPVVFNNLNTGSTYSGNTKVSIRLYATDPGGGVSKYTPGDGDILFFIDDISLIGCMQGNSSICSAPPSFTVASTDDCLQDAQNTALLAAKSEYKAYLDSVRSNFQKRYIAKCLKAFEKFEMTCNDAEYHYTLYYYDQAGNLIKTVPPEGVNKLADSQTLMNQINEDRQNNTRTVFTNHSYVTNYKYNSLNQLVSQSVPDNRDLNIWQNTNFTGIPAGYNVQSVAFNGNNGILAANNSGTGYLYSFNPSSNSWNQITSLNSGDLNDVTYVSATELYAVGKLGTVMHTTNNGGTWSFMPFSEGTAELIHIHRLSSSSTEMVAYDMAGNKYVSSSNVTQWTKTPNFLGLATGEFLKDINYNLSNNSGLAITTQNRIFTYNGTTWAANTNNLKQVPLKKVSGDGNNFMMAIGDDGTVLRSTNNGLNWTEVPSNLSADLKHLAVYNSATAYAVDAAYNIYQTSNSGPTFNLLTTTGGPGTGVSAITTYNGDLYTLNANGNLSKYSAGAWSNPLTNSLPTGTYNDLNVFNYIGLTVYYAAGNAATLKTSTGSSWLTVNTGINSLEDIIDIDIKLTGGGIGGYIIAKQTASVGKLYYFNGTTAINYTSSEDFTSVSFNGTVAYATTSNGKIFKVSYSGSSFTTSSVLPNTTGPNYRSVFANGDNVAAVGDGAGYGEIGIATGVSTGLINGGNKSNSTIPPGLNAVLNDATGQYIAGNDGTILKWQSLNWVNQVTASNTNLYAIATNGSEVVAAGQKGSTANLTNHILYDPSGPTGWTPATNTLQEINGIIINNGNVYFAGNNGVVGTCQIPNYSSLTSLATGSTEKLNALVANGNNLTIVGNSGVIFAGNGSPVSSLASQTNFNPPVINEIKWFDNTHVIGVGNAGKIIASDNAGANWKLVNSGTSNNLKAVDILDLNNAIAVGDAGTYININYTCSGSVCTYNNPLITPPSLATNYTDISIANGDVVVVDAAGNIHYKSATSSSWATPINSLASANGFNSVYMVDKNFARAVGNSGRVALINPAASTAILSTSSGNTWPYVLTSPQTNVNLNSVYFKDHTVGYAVGASGFVMKTIDGGTTWTSQTAPTSLASSNINVVAPYGNNANAIVLGGTNGGNANTVDNANEMSSRFYYDKLGRLIASQNSKQYAKDPKTYSYTKYDGLGRIKEVGEVKASSDIETLPNTNNGQIDLGAFNNWLTPGGSNAPVFTEITKTYYDDPASLSVVYDGSGSFAQTNLRNRISYTTYQDVNGTSFDHATYYSYDIHGNVNTLYQYNGLVPSTNKYRRIDYDYDLISGKVNQVSYQAGARDQFYHSYLYDDDNRVTNVFTSKDGVIWDQDAKYFYYRHGPLARTETGNEKVQGTDYAYTMHGWIKGVNSDKLSAINDQGHDATAISGNAINDFISRDALGYHLGYYNGDYSSIVAPSSTSSFLAGQAGTALNAATTNLYNGNISQAGYSIKQFIDQTGATAYRAATYQYDQLNRLLNTTNFNNFDATNNNYTTPTVTDPYKETFSYDANGNIKTATRNNGSGTLMDNLTYKYINKANNYTSNTNKLGAVQDAVGSSSNPGELYGSQAFDASTGNEVNNNYVYDNIGNLVQDLAEGISNIEWTVSGKIKSITKNSGLTTTTMLFNYDAMGNRVRKSTTTLSGGPLYTTSNQTTYYVRDAQGNVMATYEHSNLATTSPSLTQQHIFGSSRLGMLNRSDLMTGVFVPGEFFERITGNKSYELSNHLGNVMTVISDRKLPVDDGVYNSSGVQTSSTPNGQTDYFKPEILAANDYYAFGSLMPGRKYSLTNAYRYGFNGKENDNDVKGFEGTSLDFGARIYDPRVGRWFSEDPLQSKYAYKSPYMFASDNPSNRIDVDGEDDFHFYYITINVLLKLPGGGTKIVPIKSVAFYTVIKNFEKNTYTVHKITRLDQDKKIGEPLIIKENLTGVEAGKELLKFDINANYEKEIGPPSSSYTRRSQDLEVFELMNKARIVIQKEKEKAEVAEMMGFVASFFVPELIASAYESYTLAKIGAMIDAQYPTGISVEENFTFGVFDFGEQRVYFWAEMCYDGENLLFDRVALIPMDVMKGLKTMEQAHAAYKGKFSLKLYKELSTFESIAAEKGFKTFQFRGERITGVSKGEIQTSKKFKVK